METNINKAAEQCAKEYGQSLNSLILGAFLRGAEYGRKDAAQPMWIDATLHLPQKDCLCVVFYNVEGHDILGRRVDEFKNGEFLMCKELGYEALAWFEVPKAPITLRVIELKKDQEWKKRIAEKYELKKVED